MDKIAEMVERQMRNVQRENCNGCIFELPDPGDHECQTNSKDMKIYFYFSEAFDRVEKTILISTIKDALFENMLQDEIGPELTRDLLGDGQATER